MNALFYFRISVQLTLHMFRPWLGHHQCTPDDGRVAAETYVGLIEQKYENKKVHPLVKKLTINVKMHGEHNVLFTRFHSL
jgi:hypothetical protein